MSDNIKQESVESLQTKEQEQQAGSNKRTLEAENDKAAKKTFKEKKKKEKQPTDPAKKKKTQKDHSLCGDRRTRSALYPVKALWGKRGSSRGNYDAGADRGSAADD